MLPSPSYSLYWLCWFNICSGNRLYQSVISETKEQSAAGHVAGSLDAFACDVDKSVCSFTFTHCRSDE